MQKYLRRVHRGSKKREDGMNGEVERVRLELEIKADIGKEVLSAALEKDQIACIREILLFDRY